MPAKQGNNRDRIINICIMSVFTALCIVFGYVESLVPLTFIAPGVKLGLSNSIALTLIISGKVKEAFAVNISRILLSALLFGSPFSLLFSLTAGVISLLVSFLVFKTAKFSALGIAVMGSVSHNLTQLIIAVFVTGFGVIYYLPVLLIAGAVCGAAISIPAGIFAERIKKSR